LLAENSGATFDFVIESLKIIIELDREQHFSQVSNWQSPQDTQTRDIYKMRQALKNDYSIIIILQTDVFR
jgi:very-short-patch-repair endonuclease